MHGTIHFAWSGFGAGDYSFSLLLFEKRLLKVGWEIPRICDALVWLCPVFFHGFPDKKSSASCNVGISPVYERVEGRLSGMPLSFRHVLSESILSSDMAFKRLFSNSPMGLKLTALYRNYVKKNKIYEEVAEDEQNFRKLSAGRVDFITAELGNGLYIIKNLGLNKIIPLKNNPIKTDGLYIIFNKKNVPKSFVDKFSDELKNSNRSLFTNLYMKNISISDSR